MFISNLILNSFLLFISSIIASNISNKNLFKKFQNVQINNDEQSMNSSSLGSVSFLSSSPSTLITSSLSSKRGKSFSSPFLSFKDNQMSMIQASQFMEKEYVINHIRQAEIVQVLNDFPIGISKIVSDYDWYDMFLIKYYIKVMDALKISKEMRKELNFHDRRFAIHLGQILILIQNDFEQLDPFWGNLARLCFKWMIYMRGQIVDYSEFRKALNGLEQIISIIRSKAKFPFPSISNLKLKSFENSLALKTFLDCELMENPSFAYSFDLICKYFYGRIQRGMNAKILCNELKNVYFGGRFNNNFILKLMILFYDSEGKMRDSMPFFEGTLYSMNSGILSTLPNYFIDENFDGNGNVITLVPNLFNKFITRFILKRNFRFLIMNSFDLFIILRKFKESGILLTRELCEKHIVFINNFGQYSWSLKEFQKSINLSKMLISQSGANIPECNEYLNLF